MVGQDRGDEKDARKGRRGAPDVRRPHPRTLSTTSDGTRQCVLPVLPELRGLLVGLRELEPIAAMPLDNLLYSPGGLFDSSRCALELEE